MTNNSPDTLALFTTLLNLPDIAVTDIRNLPNGREVTIVKSIRDNVDCRMGL
jgi:hypothetical protein